MIFKKIVSAICTLALVCSSFAQTITPNGGTNGYNPPAGGTVQFAGVPSGACSPGQTAVNNTNGNFYYCNAGSYSQISAAAGSAAFSAVTAGTNTNALVVGTNGSLGVSGTGTISATGLNNALNTCRAQTYTANGTIAQYNLVVVDATGKFITATTSQGGIYGVAQAAATVGNPVQVCVDGYSSLIMDSTSAVGDIAIPSGVTGGHGLDSGLTSRNNIGDQKGVVGDITTGCSGAACTAIVSLEGINKVGRQVQTINNTLLSGLATGLLKITTATGAVTTLPLQGTDTNVLSSGTVSGTSSPLCTDALGGATTVSCPSGGLPSAQTRGLPLVYNSTSTATTDIVFIDTAQMPNTPTTSFASRLLNAVAACPSTGCTITGESEPTGAAIDAQVTISANNIKLILPYGTTTEAAGVNIILAGTSDLITCAVRGACILNGATNGSVGTLVLRGDYDKASGFEIIGGLLGSQSGTELTLGVGGTAHKGIVADDMYLRDSGTTAASITDCNDCELRNSRSDWSGQAGINMNATIAGISGEKAINNTINDANMIYYVGIGEINVISTGGSLANSNWVVDHNTVQTGQNGQANPLAGSYLLATPLPAFAAIESYSGCGEGIQVTAFPGPGQITNNKVKNTCEEGITASNIGNVILGNKIENNGQTCAGCAAIISSCQNQQSNCVNKGTQIVGNSIIASSTSGPSCSIASGSTFSGANVGNASRTLNTATVLMTGNTFVTGNTVVVNGYTGIYTVFNGIWLLSGTNNSGQIQFTTPQSGTIAAGTGSGATPFVSNAGGAASQQGSSTPSCTQVANNTGGGVPLGIWTHAASNGTYAVSTVATAAGNTTYTTAAGVVNSDSYTGLTCTGYGFTNAANNITGNFVSSTSNSVTIVGTGATDTTGNIVCQSNVMQDYLVADNVFTILTGSNMSNALEYNNTSGVSSYLTNVKWVNNVIDSAVSTPLNVSYLPTVNTFTLVSAAIASGGNTTYTGSGSTIGSRVFIGSNCAVSGFTAAGLFVDNGTFAFVSSTSNTITLANASGVVDATGGSVTCANTNGQVQILDIPNTPSGPVGVPETLNITPAQQGAVTSVWSVPGVPFDAKTAGASPYTVPITDNMKLLTINSASAFTLNGFPLANNYTFALINLNAGLITYTPATGTINNGNATQIIPAGWFGFHYTDNTNTVMPVMPTFQAFPTCADTLGKHLNFNIATGAISCGTSVITTPLTTGTSVSLAGPSAYFVCTTTCTVTPPTPVAGYQFCVYNGDNIATVITLAALGTTARYENTARTAYGTATTGTFVSGGAVGDSVCIVGLDATHYITPTFKGTWTAN